MATVQTVQTTFQGGEINVAALAGRSDIAAYQNGAARLRNVFVAPTGGVSRRGGFRYLATAAGPGRLIDFEFNTQQVYLLAFSHLLMEVFKDGVKQASVPIQYSASQLKQVYWTQTADTLLMVHPDLRPKRITRTSHTAWTVSDWSFLTEASGRIQQPHHKFAGDDVTLDPSGTTGTVTLVASSPVFVAGHVGARFRLSDKEVEITAVASATSATALVKETLANANPTADWSEQVFSALRGWPATVTFHQDRLVIGGSRDLPNRLWMSKSADLFNFDLGEALDDDAIGFVLLSDQVNAIRAVFSGRHLQVFTSGGEWMVTGDPLTPTGIQAFQQTRIGSPIDRTVPPENMDGATVFAARQGQQLREFLFSDVEQAYQSADLTLLAGHLICDPVALAYDRRNTRLYVLMCDGTLASVTLYRQAQITAWSLASVDGKITSIAMLGDELCVLIERADVVHIAVLDAATSTDLCVVQEVEDGGPPAAVWGGYDHLEGATLRIVADGADVGDALVEGGTIVLDVPALTVEAGLAFAHQVEPLPVPAQGRRVRPVDVTFRVSRTRYLQVDVGRGPIPLPVNRYGSARFDTAPPEFTGDVPVRAGGWRASMASPLWRIEDDSPYPFTLLAVATTLAANG